MITTPTLSSLRTLAASTCDTPCVIKHITVTSGTYGQSPEIESEGEEAMALVEEPSSSGLATYTELIAAPSTYAVHFPYGTDARENDNLYFGSKKLKVQKVLVPQSYSVFTSVEAAEVS